MNSEQTLYPLNPPCEEEPPLEKKDYVLARTIAEAHALVYKEWGMPIPRYEWIDAEDENGHPYTYTKSKPSSPSDEIDAELCALTIAIYVLAAFPWHELASRLKCGEDSYKFRWRSAVYEEISSKAQGIEDEAEFLLYERTESENEEISVIPEIIQAIEQYLQLPKSTRLITLTSSDGARVERIPIEAIGILVNQIVCYAQFGIIALPTSMQANINVPHKKTDNLGSQIIYDRLDTILDNQQQIMDQLQAQENLCTPKPHGTGAIEPAHPSSTNKHIFKKVGDAWTFAYRNSIIEGKQSHDGYYLMQILLRFPRKEFSVFELEDLWDIALCKPKRLRSNLSFDDCLDSRGIRQVRNELEKLEPELEKLHPTRDREKYREVCEKITLMKQLLNQCGFKKISKDNPVYIDRNRSRQRITHSIRDTIKTLLEFTPELALYLKSNIKTGYQVRFIGDFLDWDFGD